MINQTKVGIAIKELRKKQKLTQKDLADKLGVSDKAVSKWERGFGLPDISVLATISMVLDSDIESILEGNYTSVSKEKWCGLLDLSKYKKTTSATIFDKPLIHYQLSYFMLAGIRTIYVLCNEKQKKEILKLTYNIKTKIVFIDDIVKIPLCNLMIIKNAHFLYGQNLSRIFQKSMERKNGITVLSLPECFNKKQHIKFDSNHRITRLKKEAIETSYNYGLIPFYFVPKNCFKKINDVYRAESEGLYTEYMMRGIIYIPLNNKTEIEDASNIVKIVQKRDYPICDLKEIESRRGL